MHSQNCPLATADPKPSMVEQLSITRHLGQVELDVSHDFIEACYTLCLKSQSGRKGSDLCLFLVVFVRCLRELRPATKYMRDLCLFILRYLCLLFLRYLCLFSRVILDLKPLNLKP